MNFTKLCLVSTLCVATSACPTVAFDPDPIREDGDGGATGPAPSQDAGSTPPTAARTIISVQHGGSWGGVAWSDTIHIPYGRPDLKFEKYEAGQLTPIPDNASGIPRCAAPADQSHELAPNMYVALIPGASITCVVEPPLPAGTYRVSLMVYGPLASDAAHGINGSEFSTTFSVTGGEQTVPLVFGPCKDPALALHWKNCKSATTESACELASGTWRSNGARGVCECETHDDGCPCTSQQDCLSTCWDPSATDTLSCGLSTQGVCSAHDTPAACYCSLGSTDAHQYLCADTAP